MRRATIPLLLPRAQEACSIGIAPTTSTTLTLALGDALAMVVMDQRRFTAEDFRQLHPGGRLGLQLMSVGEIMHSGAALPLVDAIEPMAEVLVTMTAKSFGIAGVLDENGALAGVITDGDIRRNVARLMSVTAADVMTRSPRVLEPAMLAQDALLFLNENKITASFVIEAGSQKPVGLVHVHDFLRLGLT